MKSDEKHLFTTRVSRISRDIEGAFFQIERSNRWLSGVINGCIAGAAVAVVAWLVTTLQEGDLLLFACLGSSAASIVFAPLAKRNSLRTIVAAYMIASATCVVLFPLHKYTQLPIPLQCFLAVSLPVIVMRLSDTMHPAAIGSAMAFIIYDRNVQSLLLLLIAILGLLTIVKVLAYIYLEDLQFRYFMKEFRRSYYGHETTVTVAPSKGESRRHSAKDP